MSHMEQYQHLKIQLKAIKSATNYFSQKNCIGRGGFGTVYKGKVVDSKGESMVAVKRLDIKFGQGDPEFWMEIMTLNLCSHENIVSLLGYCDDDGERILVYEYASNRSLDRHVHSNDLTWVQRLKICVGAAHGLAYLHNTAASAMQLRILHCDIKSSHILLDNNWNAKISGFGLSKFAPTNSKITFLATDPVGTVGYVDPQYAETGKLTKESDVYSFGVVLFEVLCGRSFFGSKDLLRKCYEQNKISELVYSNIKDQVDMPSLKLFADKAYQCLKRNREQRPLMNQIVMALESALRIQEKDANSGVHGAEFAFGSSSTIKPPSNTHQFRHLKIPIEAIQSATNYFYEDSCIGRGGFGRVYKGELVHSTGKTMVAFKRLDSAVGQGDTEFWKEIMVLSFYKHENIVTLLGYCDDHGEKILVYEYLSKKSLDSYLASNDLTWAQRLKICVGAARGLAYLHTQTETHLRIFHRDVKSSNILLDHNWNSKISDFGLSKFAPANNQFSFMVTNPAGSFWYIDPLYKDTGLLTKESDVYSFGVVMFEVLCGRLSFRESLRPLAGLAQEYYEQNKIDELVFSNMKDEIDMSSLRLFADVAYQCLKRNREERPLMTQIVTVLEKALDIQRKFMAESFETESCM